MARTFIVSDRHNTFFTENNIKVGTQIPTEGTYRKGDIVVNIGNNTANEAMWICVEAGTPGTWEVVGAGVGGTGGGSSLVVLNESVFVNEPVNEVSLGSLVGKISNKDKLIVHHNSIHLMEGIDYEVDSEGTKIVKLTEGPWNESGEDNSLFSFELLKNVESIDGNEIVVDTKLTSMVNNVIVNTPTTEVEIGIDGFNKDNDTLLVFKNGVIMVEGVEYNVSEDNTKIISINEVWNESNVENYGITFVVFKEVVIYNGENGSITMDMLGNDVKDTINGLITITELNASNIDKNIEAISKIDLSNYATKEDLENVDVDLSPYQEKNDEGLVTTDKTIIGAINELFQDVDNGKNLIATSIGNPLITGNSTFKAMSEAILGLRRESENETDAREVLYNMMVEDGYSEATSSMTVDELIELLDDSNIEVEGVKQIVCSGAHTFILKNDGSVWSCGSNSGGQLGLGDDIDRSTFTQVTTNINNDVKQIACGVYHTFILKNDGSVWSCGWNEYGELGLGDKTNRSTFTQVTTNINNDVKQIACGLSNTVILKNDGSVWTCGSNSNGQLGVGTTDSNAHSTFTKVTTNINNDVKQISCNAHSVTVLKNDGSIWSCGFNGGGILGLGDTNDRTTFTQVTTNINNDVDYVVGGMTFTFILKNDGSVWACGNNGLGQLGLGNTNLCMTFTQISINDVKQIACGDYYTFILKNDGSLWGCGFNGKGQLGLGDNTDRHTFTKVTTNINNTVSYVACGGDEITQHAFIIKNDGSVWSCGDNSKGQLGLDDTTNRNTFNIVTSFGSSSVDEYEIKRQKLYYYLLDNDIPVTESMDIGTMLDLLVDDYINNMILGYENSLRIILTDEGVSVNNEDKMDSLIAKVDEEFSKDNNTISDLNNQIVGKNNTINSLNSQITTKNNTINSLNSQISDAKTDLVEVLSDGNVTCDTNQTLDTLISLIPNIKKPVKITNNSKMGGTVHTALYVSGSSIMDAIGNSNQGTVYATLPELNDVSYGGLTISGSFSTTTSCSHTWHVKIINETTGASLVNATSESYSNLRIDSHIGSLGSFHAGDRIKIQVIRPSDAEPDEVGISSVTFRYTIYEAN